MITLDFSRTTGELLDIIEFDGDLSIGPELPSEVTNFPVESGGTFSDSIILKPRIWTNTHRVTDTPSKADIQPAGSEGTPRTLAVWSRLLQARAGRQTCRYLDHLDAVDVVAIVNVRAVQTAETMGCLDLEITYQEILVATVQRTKVRLSHKSHGGALKNKGTQAPMFGSTAAVADANGQLLGWAAVQKNAAGDTLGTGAVVPNPALPSVTTPPTYGTQTDAGAQVVPQGKTAFERDYFHRPLLQNDAALLLEQATN